jgi:hypothetical protein
VPTIAGRGETTTQGKPAPAALPDSVLEIGLVGLGRERQPTPILAPPFFYFAYTAYFGALCEPRLGTRPAPSLWYCWASPALREVHCVPENGSLLPVAPQRSAAQCLFRRGSAEVRCQLKLAPPRPLVLHYDELKGFVDRLRTNIPCPPHGTSV